jgi:hypothetical protein
LRTTIVIISIIALLALGVVDAKADNNSNVSQSSGGMGGMGGMGGVGNGFGGAGGDSSSISHGGAGGLGGTGMGGVGTGFGGTGQGGAATASNAGNAQSSTVNFDQARYSPSGFAFAPMPTSMCQGSTGVWASFIGGLGFASSRDIEWCRVMELGRALAGMGRADLGVKIMCKFDEYASQLEECKEMNQ